MLELWPAGDQHIRQAYASAAWKQSISPSVQCPCKSRRRHRAVRFLLWGVLQPCMQIEYDVYDEADPALAPKEKGRRLPATTIPRLPVLGVYVPVKNSLLHLGMERRWKVYPPLPVSIWKRLVFREHHLLSLTPHRTKVRNSGQCLGEVIISQWRTLSYLARERIIAVPSLAVLLGSIRLSHTQEGTERESVHV